MTCRHNTVALKLGINRWLVEVHTHRSGRALYGAYPFKEVGIRLGKGGLDRRAKEVRRSTGEPGL